MKIYRRRLPHLHEVGRAIFLTWRLYGSLPSNRFFPARLESGRAFVAMDRLLDRARTGPQYLRRPDIAKIVVDSICYCELEMFDLEAYVVMANHVHLSINPRVEVSRITQPVAVHGAIGELVAGLDRIVLARGKL